MVIMTESAFLTISAWRELVPALTTSIRQIVKDAAKTLGIDTQTVSKLKCMLAFDGFKVRMLGNLIYDPNLSNPYLSRRISRTKCL